MLIGHVTVQNRPNASGKFLQQTVRFALIMTGKNWSRQPDEGSVRPVPCHGIPKQVEFHQVLICYYPVPLLEPVIHDLFDVPLLNGHAIDG